MGQQDKEEAIAGHLNDQSSALRKMQNIFHEFDSEKTGEVTEAQLMQHLQDERMKAQLASMGIEVHEAHGLFNILDTDSSNSLTIEEFLVGLMRIRGQATAL